MGGTYVGNGCLGSTIKTYKDIWNTNYDSSSEDEENQFHVKITGPTATESPTATPTFLPGQSAMPTSSDTMAPTSMPVTSTATTCVSGGTDDEVVYDVSFFYSYYS